MTQTPTPTSTHPASPGADGRTLRVGEKLGKYQIVSQLGAGGMSVVWKGYDDLLDKHVAIKQYAPAVSGVDEEELRHRFHQEARIQKRLSQRGDHLVRVLDFVVEPRGLFIVMEYVDGPNVEQILEKLQGPLDTRQAVGIIGATAIALASIHKDGFLHGDLKPSNILMPRSGGLKVADFGLSSLLSEQEHLALGTVRYMAPERFSQETIDGRSDLYSLGMIAYELLAGRPAFNQAFKAILRDQRNQKQRWMKWHCNRRAAAPPLNRLNPDTPEALSEIVARLMEKDPALRIGTADELLAAIRRHFTTQQGSLSTLTPPSADVASTPASSDEGQEPTTAMEAPGGGGSRIPLLLAVLLFVNIAVGLGIWGYQAREQARLRDQRLNDARQAFGDASSAYRDGQYASARDQFGELASAWPDHPTYGDQAEAMAQVAQARLDLASGRYDAAEATLREVAQANVLEADSLNSLIREASNRSAFARVTRDIENLIERGQFGQATQRINEQRTFNLTTEEEDRLRELAERVDQRIADARIDAVLDRARDMVDGNERREAIAYLQIELQTRDSPRIRQQLESLQRQEAYDLTLARADAAMAADRLAEAIEALEAAQAIRPDPAVLERLGELRAEVAFREGEAFREAGDFQAASRRYEAAMEIAGHARAREALADLQSSIRLQAVLDEAERSLRQGDYAQAARLFEQAADIADTPATLRRLNEARLLMTLAQARREMEAGEWEKARTSFNAALELDDSSSAARDGLAEVESRLRYQALVDEGDDLRAAGAYGEAKRAYLRARSILATDELEVRLTDTEFDHLLAQARAFMAQRNWNSARAVLISAQRIRTTDQLQSLLATVNAEMGQSSTEE